MLDNREAALPTLDHSAPSTRTGIGFVLPTEPAFSEDLDALRMARIVYQRYTMSRTMLREGLVGGYRFLDMPPTRPIPVRFPEDILRRLDAVSDRVGAKRAQIIRLCAEAWLEHFEAHGRAALPIDWREVLDSYDGRRKRGAGPSSTADDPGIQDLVDEAVPAPGISAQQTTASSHVSGEPNPSTLRTRAGKRSRKDTPS